MDYKPYKPFHDNGKDFAKLAVTCQVLQDMEKEDQAKGQTTISSKDVKPRTKEQEKADNIYCICCASIVGLSILVTIDCSAFHIKNSSGCRISTGNRMDFFLLTSGTIF